jgi:hypothetical protein
MKPPLDPSKPLKILTIDGGGLQAISTLLILDELLNTIAKTNGVPHRKPRPCDVFDTIAGIGAGGWLALLLGRFHMDITACLSEWYKLTQCITPRSKAEEMRMRVFQHCYFDPDRLVEQIDNLTKLYGTGEFLFANDGDGVRTRHLFVAALRSDAKGYNLFRTYEIPKSAKLPKKLLEGPKNPSTFKISRAFGVTGAAKYFAPPWKEQMANSGKTQFSDTKFPKPHNVTELALDEMWGLYGTDVQLSVIVNIGPGLPNTFDVRQIARRFSWGLNIQHTPSTDHKRPASPMVEPERLSKKRSPLSPKLNDTVPSPNRFSVRFHDIPGKRESTSAPGNGRRDIPRSNTFGSEKDRKFDDKLRRIESKIEHDINGKLDNIYGEGHSLYYRLALDDPPPGITQNDSLAAGTAFDATVSWLESPSVKFRMDDIAHHMRSTAEVTAAAG